MSKNSSFNFPKKIFGDLRSSSNSNSTSIGQVEKNSQSTLDKTTTVTKIPDVPRQFGELNALDLSLGALTIEDSVEKVYQVLGQPHEKKYEDNKTRRLKYDRLDVVVKNGKISAFVCRVPSLKTPRGIHSGSTVQEVFDTYGTNFISQHYEDLILYEYKVFSREGKPCWLRCAVRSSDNIVDYISMRYAENVQNMSYQNQNTDFNAENAAMVFINYHKAITNRNFDTAYNYFSADRKKNTNYKNFANSYPTTTLSEVTNWSIVSSSDSLVVLNYILNAEDKMNDGSTLYQQFSGQVEMIKEGSEWKISKAHSTKIR